MAECPSRGPDGQRMLIAYLDESYTRDNYYIAAVVIKAEHEDRLRDAILRAAGIAEAFGLPHDIELHAHEMTAGKGAWSPLRGRHRAVATIYRRALELLAEVPVEVFVRGLDVARLHARYRYPRRPHEIVLQHILEELSDHAVSRETWVTVVADELPDQSTLHGLVRTFRDLGTPGYASSTLTGIELPLSFRTSHGTPGIQAADLVAYLYHRLDGHPEGDARARRSAERLWAAIEPAIVHVWVWRP